MSKKRMDEVYKDMVIRAVDRAVYKTGYPVTHNVLKAINVTKAQAKKLVHDGLLVSVDMAVGNQVFIGYYAKDGLYPKKLQQFEEAQAREARDARLLAEAGITKSIESQE